MRFSSTVFAYYVDGGLATGRLLCPKSLSDLYENDSRTGTRDVLYLIGVQRPTNVESELPYALFNCDVRKIYENSISIWSVLIFVK
jgi:hypothetical protein